MLGAFFEFHFSFILSSACLAFACFSISSIASSSFEFASLKFFPDTDMENFDEPR